MVKPIAIQPTTWKVQKEVSTRCGTGVDGFGRLIGMGGSRKT